MRLDGSTVGLREFIQRSLDGPVMRELDFDLRLGRELRRLTSEYSIRFNPEDIICDDALADAIWQAALQLLERVGIYNVDSNRVVSLRREEVEAAAARAPKQFTVGEGKDAITIKARAHDSKAPPTIIALPARGFLRKGGIQTSVARMLDAHIPGTGPLGDLARKLKGELGDIPYLAETPGEMMWARAVVRWQRTIAGLLGKPGLWLGNAPATSPPAILACYAGDSLLNRFNSQIAVPLMPELKLNWNHLRLACAAEGMGVYRHCGTDPILGGYCRNSAETTVAVVASLLGQMAFTGDKNNLFLNVVDRQGNHTGRTPLQASSGARRAIERNLGIPMDGSQNTSNGLGTSLRLYELAALILAHTGSGWAWSWRGYSCGPGTEGEYKVDLDWKFVTRISRGVAGLSREKTNELLGRVLRLYEDQGAVDEGKPFSYYYDVRTLTPSGELVGLYDRVEQTLHSLGVPMGDMS
ncbi:MAG: monomethylamine:corrinoid methyltransferase [Chloroflexi bacterium]|nr:monomethylamine:corrinoid methyltransferase [Chloroflexota bacterium]